jgi:hypothetical protein
VEHVEGMRQMSNKEVYNILVEAGIAQSVEQLAWAGRTKDRSSSPGRGKFFSSQRQSVRFWGPPCFLFNAYWGS